MAAGWKSTATMATWAAAATWRSLSTARSPRASASARKPASRCRRASMWSVSASIPRTTPLRQGLLNRELRTRIAADGNARFRIVSEQQGPDIRTE
ncbi:hypothetical protein ACPA9J_31940 [Pseudomonas aeruginosa]